MYLHQPLWLLPLLVVRRQAGRDYQYNYQYDYDQMERDYASDRDDLNNQMYDDTPPPPARSRATRAGIPAPPTPQ